MASYPFDDLAKVIGKTIETIRIEEPNNGPDALSITFTDGSRLEIESSEWLSDMKYEESNVQA